MAVITLPTAEYLRQCFIYDPESGILTWRSRPREHFRSDHVYHASVGRCAGKLAGTVRVKGYFYVRIDSKRFAVHRVIWKIMTGEDPGAEVDHRNRDRSDNRWHNLREATSRENKLNRATRGVLQMKGVTRLPNGKYVAQATDNSRKNTHLGCFDTAEAAHEAYASFIRPLRGDFYHPD